MNFRQSLIKLGDGCYYRQLARELKNIDSVLDLGCGRWSPLEKIKKNFFAVGVDINKDCIKKSKKKKTHDQYQVADVRKVDQLFKPKSFDAVIALDLIEHLKKKEGLKLLKKMEAVAKKKVIILTPNGFTEQDLAENNPYQIHQSGWQVKDFQKRGYRVYGMRGLKCLRGEWATIRYQPWFFWGAVSTLSQPLVYFFPYFAYQLFAVKELKC